MGIQTRNTAPLLSLLRHKGLIETRVYPNDERSIVEAASIFLRTEGRLLAPESAYAIRGVIDEALEAKKRGQRPVIVVSISGSTYLDFEEKSIYSRIG
jgi:tryptophan synthase beta chain